SERQVLQAAGEKHVQEMARRDTDGFCIHYQRAPLRHAQQKAARRGGTGDPLSRLGVAPRKTARRCGLAASRFSEKGYATAGDVCKNSAALEKHATRNRVSSQILVR